MNIVFVSNYLNHHQIPFCQQVNETNGVQLTFIQVYPMEEDRVKMGWGVDIDQYPFAISYIGHEDQCKELILNAEVVLFGGVDDESYIEPRLNAGGLTIRISERIYKDGQWKMISPRGLIKKYHDHTRYRKSNVYLMCAGGYVASDFSLIHAYPDKMFTWGYFPKINTYDIDEVIKDKDSDKVKLLWAGRMIDWKHPLDALKAAKAVYDAGIEAKLTMIGDGPLRQELEDFVAVNKMESYVSFKGFMEPDKVREYMRKSHIYLFTSDYKEGWGAVLNESLNEGCAVIASSGIGAVPSMLRHGQNGYVYRCGDVNELCKIAVLLAKDKELCASLGRAGYETVSSLWNPREAAKRLVNMLSGLLSGELRYEADDGPLSRAAIISPSKGYDYTRR